MRDHQRVSALGWLLSELTTNSNIEPDGGGNTMPGFTANGMFPKLGRASGVSFPRLVDRLMQYGVNRHAEKTANRYTPRNSN